MEFFKSKFHLLHNVIFSKLQKDTSSCKSFFSWEIIKNFFPSTCSIISLLITLFFDNLNTKPNKIVLKRIFWITANVKCAKTIFKFFCSFFITVKFFKFYKAHQFPNTFQVEDRKYLTSKYCRS